MREGAVGGGAGVKTVGGRGGVGDQGSVDIYVGVVLENEEDVVVVNADTNVVRDAEAYEKYRGNVGEDVNRRNGLENL